MTNDAVNNLILDRPIQITSNGGHIGRFLWVNSDLYGSEYGMPAVNPFWGESWFICTAADLIAFLTCPLKAAKSRETNLN